MNTVPWRLLVSLAAFLDTKTVSVCIDGARAMDKDIQELAERVQNLDLYVSVLEFSQVVKDERMTLLVCDKCSNETCQSEYPANVHLLAPKAPPGSANLRLDSNWIEYKVAQQDMTVALIEHYGVKGEKISSLLGTWSEIEGLLSVPKPFKWLRRANLGGAKLKDCVLHFAPINSMKMNSEGKEEAVGIMPDVMSELESLLNFTTEEVGNLAMPYLLYLSEIFCGTLSTALLTASGA